MSHDYHDPSFTDSFPDFDNFESLTHVDLPDEQLDWGDESESVILPPLESSLNQEEDLSKRKNSEPRSETKSCETVSVEWSKKKSDPNNLSSQETLCSVSKVKTESSSQKKSNGHRSCDSYSSSPKPKNQKEKRSKSPQGSKRCQSPKLSHSPRTDSCDNPRIDFYHSSMTDRYHSSSSRGHRASPSPCNGRSPTRGYRRSPCPHYRRSSPRSNHRISRSPPDRYRSRSPVFGDSYCRNPRNHRIYRYEREGSSECMMKRRLSGDRYRRDESFDRRSESMDRGYGRRSKSSWFDRGGGRRSKSRFDHRNQGGDFANGRRNSPFNPNVGSGNSFPHIDSSTLLSDPRVEDLRINPPQGNQDARINQPPMAGLIPGHSRPNHFPRHIPSEAEMSYQSATYYRNLQVDSNQVIEAHESEWRSRETWESRAMNPNDPRVGKNANTVPLNPVDPRIPPSFQVSNQSQNRALLPTPQLRTSVEIRPFQRHPNPFHHQPIHHPPPVRHQLSIPPKMSALQRASEAFDQRHSASKEDDLRITDDQRRRQEELRRIEQEKESKKQEAIEEASKKLDEEMRKKKEVLAKEADPLNWIAQPAKSSNDLEVRFESKKNSTVVTVDCDRPDDPFKSSYGRERRSPSLEEIVLEDVPRLNPGTSSGSVGTISDHSDHNLKNRCKRCQEKECYQPEGKPMRIYCYECSRIVLAEFRVQQYRVKKNRLSSEEKLQVHKETQERARKVAQDLKANEGMDSVNSYSVPRRRSGHVVKKRQTGGTLVRGVRVAVGKPGSTRSRSLSPDGGGEMYEANDSFPDAKTFEFDSIQVSKCWNCDHKLNALSDDVILCKKCDKWNHNYHVDPVGYHNSEYRGDCIFCDQLKELKKDRKKKVEPIPSYPNVEIGDIEGDEIPSGDQNTWDFYWNYLKNGHNIKTGDIVYRKRISSDKEKKDECDIWWIQYLITDAENKPWLYAANLRLPQHIVRDKKQYFYAREVFPCIGTDENDATWFRLEDAVGRAVSLPRNQYFGGRPRGFAESDVFLMHQLWDSSEGEQGDTVKWRNEFSYFPLNEENSSWKAFKRPIKVFKRNLMIEDGSYKVYCPKVKDDRLS